MPELPEVETVKEMLKKKVINKRITDINIYYKNIIEYPTVLEFENQIKNQEIVDVKRRGKWLLFELTDYYLLSHLRMEGKYVFRNISDEIEKHEHISIILNEDLELRYKDTRKFGRMHLIKKDEIYTRKPLNELGLEPWDHNLTIDYLKEKMQKKSLPIKTVLLDQSIIVGIGNIYDNEILFLSKINPLKKCNELTDTDYENIIINTKEVLEHAIKEGGTTIKSYESAEGVHGKFQQSLNVHGKENDNCPICGTKISKIKIAGRGTYYCPNCQK